MIDIYMSLCYRNKKRRLKMVSIQIYMTKEQHKKLKMIYAETGQRISESVRQAIELYLDSKK